MLEPADTAPEAREIVGVDIGGTKIAVARVVAGVVLASHEVVTPRPATPHAVIEAVVGAIGHGSASATAIGVACAGTVQEGRVTAVTRDVLTAWTDVPLAEALEARLGLPTVVLNDGQAAAWGEAVHGAGRGREQLLYVTVSTGVGGGIVCGGRPYTGASGLAGHIGHLTVDPAGPPCSCGRRGCLERYASGHAVERAAEARLGHRVDAREVIDRARNGETWAQEIVSVSARALAGAFASLHFVVDPGLVVLGGGLGSRREYRDAVRSALSDIPAVRELELVPSALGRLAGTIGAADIAARRTS